MKQERIDNFESIDPPERRLDSLAELLEVFSESTCIALYVNEDEKIVIASNDLHEGSKGQGKTTTVQEDRISKLFNYFKDIALTGKVPDESVRVDFFTEICKKAKFLSDATAYYKALGVTESDELIYAIMNASSQKSQETLKNAYQQGGTKAAACSTWLNLYSSFVKLEKELRGCKLYLILETKGDSINLLPADVPAIIKCSDGKFKLAAVGSGNSVALQEIETSDGSLEKLFEEVTGNARKFLPWESDIVKSIVAAGYVRPQKKSDRKIPEDFFNAFKKDPVILRDEKKKNVHAESQIVASLLRKEKSAAQQTADIIHPKKNHYIGIGKLCCLRCHVFLDEANNQSSEHLFTTRGHHDIDTAWQQPSYSRGGLLDTVLTKTDQRVKSVLKHNGYSARLMEVGIQLETRMIYFEKDTASHSLQYRVIDPAGEEQSGTISSLELLGLDVIDFDSDLDLNQVAPLFLDILDITSQRGHTSKDTHKGVMEHDGSDLGTMGDSQSNPSSPQNKFKSIIDLIIDNPAKIALERLAELDLENKDKNIIFLVLSHLSRDDVFLVLRNFPPEEHTMQATLGIILVSLKSHMDIEEEILLRILTHEELVGASTANFFKSDSKKRNAPERKASDSSNASSTEQPPRKVVHESAQPSASPPPHDGADTEDEGSSKLPRL